MSASASDTTLSALPPSLPIAARVLFKLLGTLIAPVNQLMDSLKL